MDYETRYLMKRKKFWHYKRRIPAAYRSYDSRGVIRIALKTQSIFLAKHRRDAMENADNNYWAHIIAVHATPTADQKLILHSINNQYKLECLRAVTFNHIGENSNISLITTALIDVLRQLGAPIHSSSTNQPPPARVSEAFEFYYEKIALRDLLQKSRLQKKRWYTTKHRSIQNFIELAGDKYMSDLNRGDAHKIYAWWASRLVPKRGGKRISPHTANMDIGNLRKFYREYFAYFGLHDQPNPFRTLSFKTIARQNKRPCFENEWVREKFLQPGPINKLKNEARCILYLLIETGARPSEIINLKTSDIMLGIDVPYVKIRPARNRELKSPAATRNIPLVGVALQAILKYPDGFPTYQGQNALLTQYLLKSLRRFDLMPSEEHVVYSLRHSFERRMLEAGLDYGLRCRLMGQRLSRPDYGGGGSMRFRQEELLKIVHSYSDDLFD